jgi:hypothetical protein
MAIDALSDFFKRIELDTNPLNEHDVATGIRKEFEAKGIAPSSDDEVAELYAFDFCSDYRDTATGWGTYYGPKFVLPNDQGQMVEFPSIQRINGAILEYWRVRAAEAQNPILVLRYADLVVDFHKKHPGRISLFESVKYVVDMTIVVCERALDNDIGLITKLKRAFNVSKLIGYAYRFDDLKKTALAVERRIAQDDKPGLWGRVFTWLLLEGTDKIPLTDAERNELVADIENRLQRIATAEEPSAWSFECGVNLLVQYYDLSGNTVALQSILEKLESVLRSDKHSNSSGIMVTNYLQKLIDLYSRYQQHNFAKQAVERITAEMGNLGDRGKSDMHTVSAEVQITDEQKNKFIAAIFDSDLKAAVERVAVHFIPQKDKVKAQLDDLSSRFVFQYLVTSQIVSEDGYTLAQFGSISDDPDQHLVHHLSRVIHFETPFLHWSFEELRRRYTEEKLYNVLAQCPLFRADERPYLEQVLSAFWKSDFLVASTLMIPLIEDAVRNLFKLNKQQYIRWDSECRGYKLISLHKLIKTGLLKVVYRNYGESVELYLDTLLCSPIGWNLRNNGAHGVNLMSLAGEEVANRLMHVLFCLSLVSSKASEQE